MKPLVPKISALVVSAIRNLREARGSTAKDIMNYIVTEYHSGDPVIQRQTNAALKRGVDYGILRRVNGHYKLNGDPFTVNPQSLVPQDRTKRKKRHAARRRGRTVRRGRRGRGRRRAKKVSIKAQQRSVIKRKRGAAYARRVKRRAQENIEDFHKDSVSREGIRTNHPSGKPDDPKGGSSIKGREHSRSRNRSRMSQSQQRQPSRDPSREPSKHPSREPSRNPSREASRQESPANSQSSGSSDHDDQDN